MYSLKKIDSFSLIRRKIAFLSLFIVPTITRYIWKLFNRSNRYNYIDGRLYKLILTIHSKMLLLPNDSCADIFSSFGNNCTLTINTGRLTDTLALVFGIGEFDVAKLYETIKTDTDHILDIGANIGTTSIFFGAQNPKSQVHAFEPNSSIFDVLLKNIKQSHLNNVTVYNFGLGEATENSYLDIKYEGNPGSAYISTAPNGTKITLKRLDDIDSIDKFNVIKMDVEGYEYFVLLGGVNKIQKNKPKIIFEYFNGFNSENLAVNAKLIDLLSGWGYKFFVLDGTLKPIDKDFLLSLERLINVVALPNPI